MLDAHVTKRPPRRSATQFRLSPPLSDPHAVSTAGATIAVLVAGLSFTGMVWWFFSFAAQESPARLDYGNLGSGCDRFGGFAGA